MIMAIKMDKIAISQKLPENIHRTFAMYTVGVCVSSMLLGAISISFFI